jgi:hypothetical protein
MKGSSGCPAKRLRGLYCPFVNVGAGRSRSRACLYDLGRLEFVGILIEVVRPRVGVSGWLIVREGGGFVVGRVCWRHTTKSDGTWVWFLLAARGHERPDARLGAVWRAVPAEGCFL